MNWYQALVAPGKKNYSKLHVTTCVSLHVQIRLTNSESRDESKARKTLSTYNDLRFRSRSCWDLVGSENGNRPDSPMKIRPVQEQDGRWSATYSNSPSTIRTPSPYHTPEFPSRPRLPANVSSPSYVRWVLCVVLDNSRASNSSAPFFIPNYRSSI